MHFYILLFFTEHDVFEAHHVLVCISISVAFYCQIVFHCMDIYILLVYSPIDRHLDSLHFRTIVNNAAMNFCVQSLYRHIFLLLLGRYSGVEFLYHMITVYLTFKETAKRFPKWWHHFTFSTAIYDGISLCHRCL